MCLFRMPGILHKRVLQQTSTSCLKTIRNNDAGQCIHQHSRYVLRGNLEENWDSSNKYVKCLAKNEEWIAESKEISPLRPLLFTFSNLFLKKIDQQQSRRYYACYC